LKSDILQYCNEFAIPYIFDETNENSLFTRNKIRNDLLPSLEAYNPQVKKAIWRMARSISLEKTVIDKLEKEKFEQCYYRSSEKYLGLYKDVFLQMEVGIQHRVLRRGLKSLGAEEVGFELIHRILGYIRLEKPGKKFDLVSGLFLEVESDHIWMYTDQTQLPTDHWPQIYQEQKFLINHQIEIGSGWIISAKIFDISGLFSETIEANVDGFIAWIDFDKLFSKELLIKPKSKREYFQPLGMKKGSIKLKDYFINVKVPRRARKNWPLVYSKDQLVWVPGYEISEIFRVNKETQRAVQIKLRQAG